MSNLKVVLTVNKESKLQKTKNDIIGFDHVLLSGRIRLESRRRRVLSLPRPSQQEMKTQVQRERWGYEDQSYSYSLSEYLEHEQELLQAIKGDPCSCCFCKALTALGVK